MGSFHKVNGLQPVRTWISTLLVLDHFPHKCLNQRAQITSGLLFINANRSSAINLCCPLSSLWKQLYSTVFLVPPVDRGDNQPTQEFGNHQHVEAVSQNSVLLLHRNCLGKSCDTQKQAVRNMMAETKCSCVNSERWVSGTHGHIVIFVFYTSLPLQV